MADSRDSRMWNHTAEMVAAVFNTIPFSSGKMISSSRFHPYKQKPASPLPKIKAEDIAKFMQV